MGQRGPDMQKSVTLTSGLIIPCGPVSNYPEPGPEAGNRNSYRLQMNEVRAAARLILPHFMLWFRSVHRLQRGAGANAVPRASRSSSPQVPQGAAGEVARPEANHRVVALLDRFSASHRNSLSQDFAVSQTLAFLCFLFRFFTNTYLGSCAVSSAYAAARLQWSSRRGRQHFRVLRSGRCVTCCHYTSSVSSVRTMRLFGRGKPFCISLDLRTQFHTYFISYLRFFIYVTG